MEDQCSPFSWDFCYQLEEGIEDQLRHSLLYTTLELETTIVSAKEKISRKEEEVVRLKDLLSRVIEERDEAKAKCQRLVLDKLLLQQELQKQQEEVFAPQNHEVESKGSDSDKHFVASSDSDENIISSPNADPIMSQDVLTKLLGDQKALPEKGKLLQAVIEAGPLLQTLLLAGPMPQWQHPPPQLKSIEIPPVAISPPTPHLLQHQDSCISTSSNTTCFGNKRSLLHSDGSGSDSSPKSTKYQKNAKLQFVRVLKAYAWWKPNNFVPKYELTLEAVADAGVVKVYNAEIFIDSVEDLWLESVFLIVDNERPLRQYHCLGT